MLSKERWKLNSKSAAKAVSCLWRVGATAVFKRLSEIDFFLLFLTPEAGFRLSFGDVTIIEVLADRSVLGAIVSEANS